MTKKETKNRDQERERVVCITNKIGGKLMRVFIYSFRACSEVLLYTCLLVNRGPEQSGLSGLFGVMSTVALDVN